MKTDLVEAIETVIDGRLADCPIEWRPEAAVCVVMASGGYPGDYARGKEIRGIEAAESEEGVTVFHAGTRRVAGRMVTAGGRVLGVTALGADVRAAREKAYAAVAKIEFEGAHYRRDIAARALEGKDQGGRGTIAGKGGRG